MASGKLRQALVMLLVLAPGAAGAAENGARAMAVGETGTAATTDAGAAPGNVAAASLVEQYAVVAGVGFGAESRFLLRGAAVDTRTSSVTLSANYYRLTDDVVPTGEALPGWWPADEELTDPTEHQGVGVGLAYPFLDRSMSIGTTLRYDWRSSDIHGAERAFNLGVQWATKPGANLTFALAAADLLENDYPDTGRTLTAGGRWDPGAYLAVEGAAVFPLVNEWSWQAVEWHAGASVGFVQFLQLSGGYFFADGRDFATVGLTLSSAQADLDYGVKIDVSDPAYNIHAIDVRAKF